MAERPRVRVPAISRPAASASLDGFTLAGAGTPAFEAAGAGRRLRGFSPSKNHVNVAVQKAGPTLLARARWLYQNDAYAGQAVDEWTSAAVGDGIKPRPRIKNKALRSALLDLWWHWTEEADADGLSDFYGMQEKMAREVFLAGEVFVRIRSRRPDDMMTVPFQLQMLPSEMLDVSFNQSLAGNGYIRAGIEFDGIGRRVAYHFWRNHPYDHQGANYSSGLRERVRVPASEVIHIFEAREAGQIRGVPRVARILVKLFVLESYDDAELERKRAAALFTAFLIGRGENPLTVNDSVDENGLPVEDVPVAPMQPGAVVDLGDDKDIKFSSPTEVGGSYEAFQYRNLTKIAAGTGVPYSYVTGDMTKGNFSNVRTDIIRFRRRVSQWQNNTLVFQGCRPIWKRFVELAVLGEFVEIPDYDVNPSPYWASEWLPPRLEWIDPAKDIKAEREAVRAGFKSRTQVIAERGYDREDLDAEIADERGVKVDDLVFDSDAGKTSANGSSVATVAEPNDDEEADEPAGPSADEEESENAD